MSKDKRIDGHSPENINKNPELALRISAKRAVNEILESCGIENFAVDQMRGVVTVLEQFLNIQEEINKK